MGRPEDSQLEIPSKNLSPTWMEWRRRSRHLCHLLATHHSAFLRSAQSICIILIKNDRDINSILPSDEVWDLGPWVSNHWCPSEEGIPIFFRRSFHFFSHRRSIRITHAPSKEALTDGAGSDLKSELLFTITLPRLLQMFGQALSTRILRGEVSEVLDSQVNNLGRWYSFPTVLATRASESWDENAQCFGVQGTLRES